MRLPVTLAYLKSQVVPENIPWEVIVIDNASMDQTGEVAKEVWGELPGVQFRVVSEPVRGLSNARNRGLAEAKGDLICFLDDDGQPQIDWLNNLYVFSTSTNADAIVGRVTIPENLSRPWMLELHRIRLASTESINIEKPFELVGANMALRRRVLEKIPRFDCELGAGKLGFGEESLFSKQLLETGFKIMYAEKAVVEHHFDIKRLLYPDWIKSAKRRGESKAYIAYHWEHRTEDRLVKDYLLALIKFLKWKITHPKNKTKREGCSIREMRIIEHLSYYKRFLIETKQARNYKYHGLIKCVD
jgi:glycosyltransferase involved in cell wall biosynthesis